MYILLQSNSFDDNGSCVVKVPDQWEGEIFIEDILEFITILYDFDFYPYATTNDITWLCERKESTLTQFIRPSNLFIYDNKLCRKKYKRIIQLLIEEWRKEGTETMDEYDRKLLNSLTKLSN